MKIVKFLSELSIGRLMVLALVVTAGYYLNYFDDGKSVNDRIAIANGEVMTETARRAEIEKIMKKEAEMQGNVLQLERSLAVVKSKIPNDLKDTEMSAIINGVATTAGVYVVELSNIPKPITFASPNVVKDKDSIRPEDLIEEVRFKVVVSGSYDGLLKFLDALANKEEKVIKVRNFSIEKSSSSIDDDSITFKSEIVGFKQSALAIGEETK